MRCNFSAVNLYTGHIHFLTNAPLLSVVSHAVDHRFYSVLQIPNWLLESIPVHKLFPVTISSVTLYNYHLLGPPEASTSSDIIQPAAFNKLWSFNNLLLRISTSIYLFVFFVLFFIYHERGIPNRVLGLRSCNKSSWLWEFGADPGNLNTMGGILANSNCCGKKWNHRKHGVYRTLWRAIRIAKMFALSPPLGLKHWAICHTSR